MTRDEIIEAIRTLDSGKLNERKRDALVVRLNNALPHSSISGLIYYESPELTAEQVADEALRRERDWLARNQ